MQSTSVIVDRALRTCVVPLLREAGFAKAGARKAWRWQNNLIWVFNIRTVGHYFSTVTGWPPGSVCVWLGLYFTFMPREPRMPRDNHGRELPAEHQCHLRSHLECGLDQQADTKQLLNPAERSRKDIWWVHPDGSPAARVAFDIAMALKEQGLPWFIAQSNLESVLVELDSRHDCFTKFDQAAFVARALGDHPRWRQYAALAEFEGRRIGLTYDWQARYGCA